MSQAIKCPICKVSINEEFIKEDKKIINHKDQLALFNRHNGKAWYEITTVG
jgi:hypothetical protein